MASRWHVAVAMAYVGLALWTMRPVLADMAGSYPMPVQMSPGAISDSDQSHMVWVASRTARTLATAPWRLWDFEFCHPFPKAVALGHHNYASALIAALPYAVTGEPILAHNVVSVVMLWLSALGMYALAYYWTRSVPAAFVAGVLFGFHHDRLVALRWPALVGNEWTPLALLFTHRLFDRERWRDAAAVAFFAGMQILESFYQLFPLAVFGLLYGGVVAVRRRARLRSLAPKLLTVVALLVIAAAIVAIPYAQVQETWRALVGHRNMFPPLRTFLPGQRLYPGTVLLALAVVGLVDRIRRRRGDDPRLPFLVAGLLVLAVIVGGTVVPGIGFVRSPGQWLARYIPGLNLVRGFQFGVQGVWLALCLLAAYGILALTKRRAMPMAVAVALLLTGLTLLETFHPVLAPATFAISARQAAAPLSVPRTLLALLETKLPDGAVLDLPADNPKLAIGQRAHRLLLASFHRHPIAICCASFESPLGPDVEALGIRLPDPRAAEALHALGFRSVLLHEEDVREPSKLGALRVRLRSPSTGTPCLVEIGSAEGHRLYRLEGKAPVRSDLAALAAGVTGARVATQPVGSGSHAIELTFRNAGPETFRHPDPIAPTAFVARWYALADDTLVAEEHVRHTLPLALAAEDVATRRIPLAVPASPGLYRIALAPANAPDTVVAVARVTLLPPAAVTGAP